MSGQAEEEPAPATAVPGTPGARGGARARLESMLYQGEAQPVEDATGEEEEEGRKGGMEARLAMLEKHFSSKGPSSPAPVAPPTEPTEEAGIGERCTDLHTRMQADEARVIATQEPEEESDADGSKKGEINRRLGALQTQFEKQQSSEAEKFKILDMMLRRLSDELTVERISQADITERNTREIKILEHSLLLDVNVHKQARRDLDKIIAKEIDEKCAVVRQELGAETQMRIASGSQVGMDPDILPSLTDKVEQEGRLRHDRGEQIMAKIDQTNEGLHNMLAAEQNVHAKVEEFSGTLSTKCAELKDMIHDEANERAVMEQRHGQHLEQLRSLSATISSIRQQRTDAVERITAKVADEMARIGESCTSEQGSRADGEENILGMLEEVTHKLQDDMKKERKARHVSEESFFKLLEDSCRRAVPTEPLGLPSTAEAVGLPALN
eukprot:TRINITY_DN10137_c0_g1_i2.p1 TRINITY_DN10137_c0_g1~~TRINITY_DN10137_c0_g1_i2.p1  ORF type:complete len:441 (-),score=107.47 TRINITY_DN10137_c0_g1_i2:55-1377(-)